MTNKNSDLTRALEHLTAAWKLLSAADELASPYLDTTLLGSLVEDCSVAETAVKEAMLSPEEKRTKEIEFSRHQIDFWERLISTMDDEAEITLFRMYQKQEQWRLEGLLQSDDQRPE